MSDLEQKKQSIYSRVKSGELDLNTLSGAQRTAVEKIVAEYDNKSQLASEDLYGVKPIQEMHPDISMLDRAIVQNFGSNIDQSLEYLQQKYGDKLLFDKINGQLVARKPTEKEWRVLDPDYLGSGVLEGAKEVVRDLTDVAYDIPAGIAQGAATTAAGVAGLPLGPAGALGSAALAGGATGGALEATRQGIGNLLGVSQGVDKTNLGLATGLGFAGPLAFGSGLAKGAVKDTVAKAATKQGVLQKALGLSSAEAKETLTKGMEGLLPSQRKLLEEYVKESSQGVFSQPIKKALGFISGFSPKAVNTAQKPISDILRRQLERMGVDLDPDRVYSQQEVAELLTTRGEGDEIGKMTINAVADEIKRTRRSIGAKMNLARKVSGEAGVEIDIYDASKPLREYADRLKAMQTRDFSPERQKRINQAQNIIDEFLSTKIPDPNDPTKSIIVPVTKLPPEETFDRQQALKDRLLDTFGGDKYEDAFGKIASELESQVTHTETNIRNQLKRQIGATDIYKEYAENEAMADALKLSLKDPKKAGKTLGNIDTKSNAGLKKKFTEFDDKYGANTSELSELMQTWKHFTEQGTMSSFGRGSEVAQRSRAAGLFAGTLAGGAAKLLGVDPQTSGLIGLGVGTTAPTTIQYLTTPQKIAKYTDIGTKIGRGTDAVAEVTQEALNKLGSALPTPVQRPYSLGVQGMQSALRPNMLPSSAWLLMRDRGENQ